MRSAVRAWASAITFAAFSCLSSPAFADAPAELTSPAPGSTLTASTVQFQWTGGVGVSRYYLEVGTAEGGSQFYGQDRGTNLSATVAGLPTDGSRVYARLWSQIGASWYFRDYDFVAYNSTIVTPAEMTAPAPGSTLTASTVQFQWSGGSGITQYWLYVGTTVGGFDLFDQDRGTNLSATVAGLPSNGSTIYVRLWSFNRSTWLHNDYTYTAMTSSTAPAQMTTPAPGSTLTSSTVQFQWSGGAGVSQYWFYLGTTPGGAQLVNEDRGTNLSRTVSGLPADGSALYVRLWSLIGGTWEYRDATYTAMTPGATTAPAQMTTPAPGSTLTSSTVQFQWSGGMGVSQYWFYLGTTEGGAQLVNEDRGTSLSKTVSGLPADGSTLYVRLWSLIGSMWEFRDYTYTAMTAAGTGTPAQVTTPAPGSTLTASTVQFQWAGGSGVSQYWFYAGTTPGGAQLYNADRGTSLSATVTGLPADGSPVYVRLWSLIGSTWEYRDATYTAMTAGTVSGTPQLTTPAPGSTLMASTVQFQWTGGSGVSQYWFYVGTTPGGAQYYSADRGTSLSATVSGLPTGGITLYVRLWWLVGSTWEYADYTYTSS